MRKKSKLTTILKVLAVIAGLFLAVDLIELFLQIHRRNTELRDQAEAHIRRVREARKKRRKERLTKLYDVHEHIRGRRKKRREHLKAMRERIEHGEH